MGRSKQKLIKNKYICRVLFEFVKDEDGLNSNKLTKKISKAQTTIFEHIKELEKQNLIYKKGINYYINYDSFQNLYLDYTKSGVLGCDDLYIIHKCIENELFETLEEIFIFLPKYYKISYIMNKTGNNNK